MLFSYALLVFALITSTSMILAAPFRHTSSVLDHLDHESEDLDPGEPLTLPSSVHLITGNWKLLPHLLTGGDPAALVAMEPALLSFGTVNGNLIWWHGPGPEFPFPKGADRTRPYVNYLPRGAQRLEVNDIEDHFTGAIVGYWGEDKPEEHSPKYIRIKRSSTGVYLTRALTAEEKQWARETQESMGHHP